MVSLLLNVIYLQVKEANLHYFLILVSTGDKPSTIAGVVDVVNEEDDRYSKLSHQED